MPVGQPVLERERERGVWRVGGLGEGGRWECNRMDDGSGWG